MASIPGEGSATLAREQTTFRPSWSAAFASLALVLASAAVIRVVQKSDHSTPPSPPVVVEQNSPSIESLASMVRIPNAQELREWSQNLDQPLKTELQSVVHDAKQALQLLAHNFLPEQYQPSFVTEDSGN